METLNIMTADDLGKITGMIERLTSEIQNVMKKANNPFEEKWLNNEDVSRALKVSLRTLQTYRDNGTLPFSTIGGKVLYKASDIENVLHSNYRPRR